MKEIKWNGSEKIVRKLRPGHTLEIEPCGDGIKLVTYWTNGLGERKIVGQKVINSKSLTGW